MVVNVDPIITFNPINMKLFLNHKLFHKTHVIQDPKYRSQGNNVLKILQILYLMKSREIKNCQSKVKDLKTTQVQDGLEGFS